MRTRTHFKTHFVSLVSGVQSKCVRPFFASTESQESESDMNIARQCALRYIQAMLYIRSLLSEPELVIAESNLVVICTDQEYNLSDYWRDPPRDPGSPNLQRWNQQKPTERKRINPTLFNYGVSDLVMTEVKETEVSHARKTSIMKVFQ